MSHFPFEQGPIRPPSESQSLLIRLTRGCHWNKCHFCGLYKNMPYSVRTLEAVCQDIHRAAEYYAGYSFTSCFLQDGDAFLLPTGKLLQILKEITSRFPSIQHITSYARANSITRKSMQELKEIRSAGLNHIYCGMESGSDIILKQVNKGITSEDIIHSGLAVKDAGMTLSEFILLGIGGKEFWRENAEKTADVLNVVNPDYIRVHATAIKQETELGQAVKRGTFQLQSEEEMIIEQRLLIDRLENITSVYLNEHAVNLLMEVNGKLPYDKERMLSVIDDYLRLSSSEKLNFALGRRLGYYHTLMDMKNLSLKKKIDEQLREITERYNDIDFNRICNYFREQMI